jgi:hypothetical protein
MTMTTMTMISRRTMMDEEECPRCGAPTDPDWYCSEGYCPKCCVETDEGAS